MATFYFAQHKVNRSALRTGQTLDAAKAQCEWLAFTYGGVATLKGNDGLVYGKFSMAKEWHAQRYLGTSRTK